MFQKEKDYPGNYDGKFTFVKSNKVIKEAQNQTPSDILYSKSNKQKETEKQEEEKKGIIKNIG